MGIARLITITLLSVLGFSGVTCMHAQLAPLQHQEVLDGVPLPTSMVFLPDGRALVTSLNGRVWITSPMDELPVTFSLWMSLDTLINNSAEHGLLEIMLDPNFATNDYVYLYWSTRQNKNRLSRFTHLGNNSNLSTETIIYETQDDFAGCCHIGGAAAFINDGTIILSVGDDFQPLLAQDMASAFGKVHRINADGSIPTDNPYYDTTPGQFNANGVLKTIYASGVRNPFRGAYDPVTDVFLIGEVGGNDHSNAWEDTHKLSQGANFGWPFCGATGRDIAGNCNDPSFDDPLTTYAHNGLGASVTAGCFYRNGGWPSQWEGRYFYGDFVRGWINYIEFDANGNIIDEQPVIDESVFPGLTAEFVVKILVGPDGNLYYIILYDDFVTGTGSIHRLLNTPNQIPVCDSIWATPTFGAGPNMLVEFDGTVTDPEGYPLTYKWVFGDGMPDGNNLNVQHTYATYGTYEADLIVADDEHVHSCGQIQVTVGQAPIALITSPADSSTFQAGETITFDGWFSDDGPIGLSNVEWDVVFNHDSHVHPENGASGIDEFDFTIPTTGHDFTGNTWYTVTFTVTDEDGLTTSHSVRIFPEKQTVNYQSVPSGLEILVNSLPYVTPYSEDHAIGTELIVSIPNNQQCIGADGYLFQQWSQGQPGTFIHTVPATVSTISAEFMADGPCDHCGNAVDFDGVDDVITLDSLELSGNLTIEFWLELDPVITAQDVVLGNDSSFSIDMTGGKLTVYDTSTVLRSSIIASPNDWTHYALVRNNGNWSLYVDGVLDAGAQTFGTHQNMLYLSKIGQSFRNNGLDGALDELRIWSVAKSASDIQSTMDVLVDASQSDLLLYWRFDQPLGSQNIIDLASTGLNGIAGADNNPDMDEPTFFDPNGPMGFSCPRDVALQLKVILQGPYDSNTGLMRDNLRADGLLPLQEPYTGLGFNQHGSGGETAMSGAYNTTGANAIVDWILVELRDPNDPSVVLKTIIGLLQRDGDIVGLDGTSPLMVSAERPSYKIAVRHRNHLGIMALNALNFGQAGAAVTLDLTNPSTQMFGTDARKNLGVKKGMHSGNGVTDNAVKYSGSSNDRDAILVDIGGVIPTAVVFGYSTLDLNLDGVIKYAGPVNDRDIILVNIGGNVPTTVIIEQLP